MRSLVAFARASLPCAGGMCSCDMSKPISQSAEKPDVSTAVRNDWNAWASDGVSRVMMPLISEGERYPGCCTVGVDSLTTKRFETSLQC